MTRKLLLLAAATITLMLAGCGVEGEAYQPMPVPAAKSVIYLYRPYSFLGSGNAPIITCGHQSIELAAGGYYAFAEDSGPIACSAAAAGAPELKFDAHSGESYYIREDTNVAQSTGGVQLSLIDPAKARDQIADTRLEALPEKAARR